MYSATVHWYTDIVFNRSLNTDEFNLDYLNLFDKYFFSTVRYIVSENHISIYNSLISTLVDGIHIPDYYKNELWNYIHLLLDQDIDLFQRINNQYDIEKRVEELIKSEIDLYTKDNLGLWLNKYDELKNIIEPNLNNEQMNKANSIYYKIVNYAISQFKYENLLEIVFTIGAYCLFKKRYEYIKYLWEYKQPPDSDASWSGHDITPRNLNEVLSFYFRKGLFKRKLDFWEGHHGSGTYYKQYFLLLLTRELQNKIENFENYKLPDFHIERLSSIELSIDGFIELATLLKKNSLMFEVIGFNTDKIEEIIEIKLIPLLKKIKEQAHIQISSKRIKDIISQKKVAQFKNDVIENFYKHAKLREIFHKYLQIYNAKFNEELVSAKKRFGFCIYEDKEAFFDEWHVNYGDFGQNYGYRLAIDENELLLDIISNECKKIVIDEFNTIVENFSNPSKILIFATNTALWHFSEHFSNFQSKWHKDINKPDLESFGGWFYFKGHPIPVFEASFWKSRKQILILNTETIGHLDQLPPLNDGDDEKLIKDIFYMDIQAFSENNNLLESFMKKPSDWLQKMGDEQKQKDYLLRRVRIQIFERFEYGKSDNFEGYRLY